MPLLFEPYTLRSLTLRNRIVVSPMCQYSAENGFANDWHLVHLATRAIGGAGLVITEAAAVLPEGRISAADLGIWSDEHIAPLKKITDMLRQHGAVAGIQLAHAGRKASTSPPWENRGAVIPEKEGGWQTVSATNRAFREGDPAPQALDTAGIKDVTTAFRDAARRSLAAGFQVVEIHAAHGYLIHQFLSPLANDRQDEYGGSFENRCRLLMEVIDAVKEVWPAELALFVRISATDWADGGWTPEDSVMLAHKLKAAGVDLVDCSSGAIAPGIRIDAKPGYQVFLAEKVKREAGIATGAVGMITTAQQAEDILANGEADLIFLARELLRNPYFPLLAAKELGAEVAWPVQYERAAL